MTALECTRLVLDKFRVKTNFGAGVSAREIVSKCGQPGNIPEFAGNKKIQDFIWKNLNDEDFLTSLGTQPGSTKTLRELDNQGLVAFYMTSRLPSTKSATEKWLKQNKYPELPVRYRDDHIREQNWKMIYLDRLPGEYLLIDDAVVALAPFLNKHTTQLIWFNPYDRKIRLDDSDQKVKKFNNWQELPKILFT